MLFQKIGLKYINSVLICIDFFTFMVYLKRWRKERDENGTKSG